MHRIRLPGRAVPEMNPAELQPQVYDKLRRLAAARLASEKPGQTLDTAALVHEAFPELHNRHRQRVALGMSEPVGQALQPGFLRGFGDRSHHPRNPVNHG
jgi:ECF sigma factor